VRRLWARKNLLALNENILRLPYFLTHPIPLESVAFLLAFRDRLDLHMQCLFRRYLRAVASKVVVKAYIAAGIVISYITYIFMLKIMFGSASTQLRGRANRCAITRCKNSRQPLPEGKYAKEKLCFTPHFSENV